MTTSDSDSLIRAAAFEQIRRLLVTRDQLTSKDLAAGFLFAGVRVPFVNPMRGIFKPRQMKGLLSIRTVFPRTGNRVWYDDQRVVHRQIYEGEDTIDYAFMGMVRDAEANLAATRSTLSDPLGFQKKKASAQKMAIAIVSAGVILTHCAEVKVTHLGEDDGFFGAVDVDPGGSSGDTSDGPKGRRGEIDREAAGLLA